MSILWVGHCVNKYIIITFFSATGAAVATGTAAAAGAGAAAGTGAAAAAAPGWIYTQRNLRS